MSELKITVTKNGPYKVEGSVDMFDREGNALEGREGKAVFLCRCGQSANKPYCDGAHNRVGFAPDDEDT